MGTGALDRYEFGYIAQTHETEGKCKVIDPDEVSTGHYQVLDRPCPLSLKYLDRMAAEGGSCGVQASPVSRPIDEYERSYSLTPMAA
jgi:hypothetical protein